jgi:signal transduction histidine kinase
MNWKSVGAIFNIFGSAQFAPGPPAVFVQRSERFAVERSQERPDWRLVSRLEKQAEEALSLAQARADLLAKVSHELRSPLTSVLGMAEMLDYGVYGPLSREQKEAVKLISDCTQQMRRLISDLLEQSSLERGAFQLEETDFALDDLVQQLRRQMGPAARAKDLRLVVQVAPEMPERLFGDALRLYQVLQNLVDNAIKYTEAGQVLVRFLWLEDSTFAVQVSDTGVGIPKEMQAAIFDPYRQVHPNGNGNGSAHWHTNGFGLGLSIVKQLVSLMDGEICVTSQMGQGSIFTVQIPMRNCEERPE